MFRKILVFVSISSVISLSLFAQGLTVDEILEKHFKSKGGLERIKAIKTARMGGKLTLGPGNEAPFKMIFKRPFKIRTEYTVQGMVGVQAYDGEKAWAVMPFIGIDKPTPADENQTRSLRETADLDGPLVDWKEKGNTVELLGQEEVLGKRAYNLKVTREDGNIRFIYLDIESFLAVKQEFTASFQDQQTVIETIFSDYKDVDGLLIPHSIENRAKGSVVGQKTVIYTVELNLDVSDEVFAMPN